MTSKCSKKVEMLTTDTKLDRRIILEARSLCKLGYSVRVVAFPWLDEGETYDSEEFVVHRLAPNSAANWSAVSSYLLLYRLYRALRLKSLLRLKFLGKSKMLVRSLVMDIEGMYTVPFLQTALEAKAHVYHVHDLQPLGAGAVAAKRGNAKLVYDSHELFIEQEFSKFEKEKWRRFEEKYIREADKVVTVNYSIAEELRKRYRIPLPCVLQNCESRAHLKSQNVAGRDEVRRKFGILEGEKMLLYQGGLVANRNLEVMVKAMCYVQNPAVKMVLLGNGDLRSELKGLILKHHLQRRVLLLQGVPQDELLRITSLATVGVIPYQANCLNTYYCTPNKLYEFVAARIPMLVSDLPELRRIVEAFELGWVNDLSTPERFGLAIDRAFSDDREVQRIRQNSLRAFEELCWEKEEEKLFEVYEQL